MFGLILCIFIVINHVFSQNTPILQSTWLSSQYCSGPPDIFYEYGNYSTYPPTATDFLTLPQSGSCGNSPIPVFDGCCSGLLDLSPDFSYGIQSTAGDFVFDTKSSLIPKAANGHSYCQLSSLDAGTALWGYDVALYIDSTGTCMDSTIVCSSDRLYIFNNCTDDREVYNINATSKTINSTILGQLSIQKVVISGGTLKMQWTQQIPDTLVVPGYSAFGIVSICCYVLVFGGMLFNIMSVGSAYLRQRKRQHQYVLFCQGLWLIRFATRVYYIYTVFDDTDSFFRFLSWANFALIATLIDSLISASMVKDLYLLRRHQSMFLYTAVFLVHIFMIGPSYMIFTYFTNQELFDVIANYNIRNTFYDYWMVIMFVFDTLPILKLVFMFYRAEKFKLLTTGSKIREIQVDRRIGILVQLSVVNTVLYMIVCYIGLYTTILGDDINVFTFSAFYYLLEMLHSLLVINTRLLLTQNLEKVMKSSSFGKRTSSVKQKRNVRIAVQVGIKEISAPPSENSRSLAAQVMEEADQDSPQTLVGLSPRPEATPPPQENENTLFEANYDGRTLFKQ